MASPRHASPTRTGYASLLAGREFRALYAAQALSLVGDQVARIAVALAVFSRTHSALLTAASYAVPYLAWLIAGPLLSTLADRYPRRRIMLAADILRVFLVVGLAMLAQDTPALFALLVLVSAIEPAFKSARAALLPAIAPGAAYPRALSLFAVTSQLSQVAGFAAGGVVTAIVGTRAALYFDAGTFAVSALLVRAFLAERPAAGASPGALAGVFEAVRALWQVPMIRSVLALTWTGAAFGVVPEGLAVVYARGHGAGPLGAALLTAALPTGTVIGALLLGRLDERHDRTRLLRPLAAATFAPLLLVALGPPLPAAFALWAASGAGGAFTVLAYQVFTAAVPDRLRGRAFGLASTGLLAAQGLTLVGAGAVGDRLPARLVIAGTGLLGLTAVAAVAAGWPARARTAAPLPTGELVR